MTEEARQVVWFELWATDVGAAKRFYGALFGWTFEPLSDYDRDPLGNKLGPWSE